MKIKNIKLSLLILGSLIILSFAFFSYAQESFATDNNVFADSDQDGLSDAEEKTYGTDPRKPDTDGDSYADGAEIRAGYDPSRPAPGDKIIPENTVETVISDSSVNDSENNMTAEVINRVSALVNADPAGQNQEISVDDLQKLVDDTLSSKITEADIPEINKDEIKIKKQNYSNLSKEKRKAKERDDFVSYIAAVSYILSSNSPEPITSETDAQNIFTSFSKQITSAMISRNPAVLENLNRSAEKSLEQMKDVEVPEALIDLHVKGLSFANYAISLKNNLSPNPEDPFADMVNFSKMQGFLETVSGFTSEVQAKFTEYDVSPIEPLSQLENYGITSKKDN